MEIPAWNGPGGLRDQIKQLEGLLSTSRNPGDTEIVKAATLLYQRMLSWPADIRKTIDAFDPKVSGDLGDFQIEVGLHLQRAGRR